MDLAPLGADSAGVWTRRTASDLKLSDAQIDHRVATGEWQRMARGVLADSGVVPDPLMRGWTVVHAGGGFGRAWAAGRTTARLLGLPLIDDDDPATGAKEHGMDDVAVLATRHPRHRGTLTVQRLALVHGDTMLIGGCPSLTLDKALPGLAGTLSFEALVCLLDAALHNGVIDLDRLEAVVAAQAGRRSCRALRRAVDLADGRAESPAESLARLLLLPDLPGLVPQVELFDHAMREIARFDLADKDLKLAVEADGMRGHAGAQMAAKDQRRDRTTGGYGWVTERCTWWELRRAQQQLRSRVLATAERLRHRGRRRS